MPRVCEFCPGHSGIQAASINAGQFGLVLSVMKEKTSLVLGRRLAGYLGCNERFNPRHVNLFGSYSHDIVSLHVHPVGRGRVERTGKA